MKIEKGKSYFTKTGVRVDIVADDLGGPRPMCGILRFSDGSTSVQTWSESGEYYAGFECRTHDDNMDLVPEYVDKPEFDRSLLPAWANKAIASDRRGNWYAFGSAPEWNGWGWSGGRGSEVVYIPEKYAPTWDGDMKDSLLVWEDDE